MQDEILRLQGLLQKTILFITHDFDEALRLADRIAIMKVRKHAIIETVAEAVLTERDSVQVVDDVGVPVGILSGKTILHILFGARGKADPVG